MTTKPVTNVSIKDGKLVRKRSYVTKRRKLKADRLEKAWKERSK